MEIIEIRKHSLHNMEHYQFATQVIKLCEEAGIEKLKTLLKTLKDAVAEEDKALNIPRKKEGTADLEALDRARDHAYRALQLLVEMNLLSEDIDEQKAAQKMENVMSRYPKVTTSNYN
ncbi:MAG: hemagglutinin, partial [Prevotella salivae]